MMHVHASKIFGACIAIMCAFALLSWYMYRSLHDTMVTVLKLKQQYADHVITYRRLINAVDSSDEYDDERDCSFDIVNRDFSYLRESALDYAKDHKLEGLVTSMYDPDWVHRSIAAQQRRRAPRARQRSSTQRPIVGVSSVYRKELQLLVPIDRSRFWISSRFGPRKGRNGALGFHQGVDMAALTGTPVKAATSGTVIESSSSPYGYGNCIVVQHSQKYKTRYAHLDTLKVKKGDRVAKGQLIGTVGSTGSVRGVNGGKNASHLHFEVMVYGNRIDPLQMIL